VDRAVIHLNIADFAVAVEARRDAGLRNRPLIIAPGGASRAVVYDMSEEAYREGVRKGMPLARALRLNRQIPVLSPSFNRYEKVMKALFKEALAFTPLVECGASDGHLFMDVTGTARLFGPSVDVAFRLRKQFKNTFGLDPVWSVATSKLVAKVATRMVKPVGEYIVAPGDEAAFLAPLPLYLIPGMEKQDLKRFREFNLVSVAQTRDLTLEQLSVPFQDRAALIYDRVRGIDPTPVARAGDLGASLSADHEFSDDTNHAGVLRKALYLLVEKVCRDLRRRNLHSREIRLMLSYSDGLQNGSASRLSPATANDMAMFKACARLLDRAWTRRVRIRHLGLVCEKLSAPAVQGDLFASDAGLARQEALVRALDRIRDRFGAGAIQAGPALAAAEGVP
jgi:DNA polymerase-4